LVASLIFADVQLLASFRPHLITTLMTKDPRYSRHVDAPASGSAFHRTRNGAIPRNGFSSLMLTVRAGPGMSAQTAGVLRRTALTSSIPGCCPRRGRHPEFDNLFVCIVPYNVCHQKIEIGRPAPAPDPASPSGPAPSDERSVDAQRRTAYFSTSGACFHRTASSQCSCGRSSSSAAIARLLQPVRVCSPLLYKRG
jgi:hypothetical protein